MIDSLPLICYSQVSGVLLTVWLNYERRDERKVGVSIEKQENFFGDAVRYPYVFFVSGYFCFGDGSGRTE